MLLMLPSSSAIDPESLHGRRRMVMGTMRRLSHFFGPAICKRVPYGYVLSSRTRRVRFGSPAEHTAAHGEHSNGRMAPALPLPFSNLLATKKERPRMRALFLWLGECKDVATATRITIPVAWECVLFEHVSSSPIGERRYRRGNSFLGLMVDALTILLRTHSLGIVQSGVPRRQYGVNAHIPSTLFSSKGRYSWEFFLSNPSFECNGLRTGEPADGDRR